MGDSDEHELFRSQMRDVRRLRAPDRVPTNERPKPKPLARFTRLDELDVLRESLLPPDDIAVMETGEELSFRRPHISEAILKKLRRGHFAVEAELDLHGLAAHEARSELRDFLLEAVDRGMTCVRVIHGKGRRSGPRGPVLKAMVNHWLQRANVVLAFGSARPVDGGSGAIYVLLRRQL
jgi:DNA-nicking Smr family endonuclease